MPQVDRQLILPQHLVKQFGALQILVAIKNHDRIVERRSAVPTRVVQVEQFCQERMVGRELEIVLYLPLPDLRPQLPAGCDFHYICEKKKTGLILASKKDKP